MNISKLLTEEEKKRFIDMPEDILNYYLNFIECLGIPEGYLLNMESENKQFELDFGEEEYAEHN